MNHIVDRSQGQPGKPDCLVQGTRCAKRDQHRPARLTRIRKRTWSLIGLCLAFRAGDAALHAQCASNTAGSAPSNSAHLDCPAADLTVLGPVTQFPNLEIQST